MSNFKAKPTVPKAGLYFLLSGLAAAVVFYAVLFGYNVAVPAPPRDGDPTELSMLEQCRQVCLAYGLVPTGDVKADAEAYLKVVRTDALPAETAAVLADTAYTPTPSDGHPLLGKAAPGFTLPDHTGKPVTLSDLRAKGPVVVVFYYGYHCSHCVAQLFALNDDLKHFANLGATVVAVSADPPEDTAARIAEYGTFGFPVVSDAGNEVAEAYGTFAPGEDGSEDGLLHGTFIVSRSGEVAWAYTGLTPFVANKSLLFTLAKEREAETATASASVPGVRH